MALEQSKNVPLNHVFVNLIFFLVFVFVCSYMCGLMSNKILAFLLNYSVCLCPSRPLSSVFLSRPPPTCQRSSLPLSLRRPLTRCTSSTRPSPRYESWWTIPTNMPQLRYTGSQMPACMPHWLDSKTGRSLHVIYLLIWISLIVKIINGFNINSEM